MFEHEETYENCYDVIETLIHPYSIYYKQLNLDTITNEVYQSYKKTKHTKNKSKTAFVTIIIDYIQKYNVMLRGNMMSYFMMSYFMNIILLEGLCPYVEEDEMSSILAVSYMRKQDFFIKDCGDKLDNYYNMLIAKMNPYLLKKYNVL